MTVFQRNVYVGEQQPQQPRHDDGSRYRFRMQYNGDKEIAYCGSADELLDVLIRGYQAQDEPAQLQSRIRLAIGVQVIEQAYINANVPADEWNKLPDDDKGVLNGNRDEQPPVDEWMCEVPLVLVDTAYAPFSDVPRPISGIADVVNPPNLLWLRPAEPWEFLVSLVQVGYISLEEALPE